MSNEDSLEDLIDKKSKNTLSSDKKEYAIPVEQRKIAYLRHIATDMGTCGSYCSHCDFDFGGDPLKHFDSCPGCNYTLKEGGMFCGSGGSDF